MIRLILEYDGTDFSGWQVQPGERTVQAELERSLKELTGEEIRTVAAGRTDAGVHALGQVASFSTESSHPPGVFVKALNARLPPDASVLAAEEASPGFNARYSAVGKTYRYLILDRAERAALDRSRVWHLRRPLDAESMREAARALVGEHDFSSFRSASCEAKSPVRTMRRAEVFRRGPLICIEFHASGFLKQMARAMAGTLVEVGEGKRRWEDMASVLEARGRDAAGRTAPACGLYLVSVDYH